MRFDSQPQQQLTSILRVMLSQRRLISKLGASQLKPIGYGDVFWTAHSAAHDAGHAGRLGDGLNVLCGRCFVSGIVQVLSKARHKAEAAKSWIHFTCTATCPGLAFLQVACRRSMLIKATRSRTLPLRSRGLRCQGAVRPTS